MCNEIIGRAVEVGASEVQMTCGDSGATIRYRIGGVFEAELKLPTAVADSIRDRFKILARVGVAVRNRPQTGTFRLTLKGQPTAVSLSTQPTAAGETIVLQMADQRSGRHGGVRRSGSRSRVLIATTSRSRGCSSSSCSSVTTSTVLEAQNGDEAIAIAKREHPDLVLLDLNMPVMDGYEAIHHLRHDPSLAGPSDHRAHGRRRPDRRAARARDGRRRLHDQAVRGRDSAGAGPRGVRPIEDAGRLA